MLTELNKNDKFLYHQFKEKISFYDKRIGGKSNSTSKSFRLEGNSLYGKNKFRDALICYVKCIKFAIKSSEDLAIGYANKSASLYHLKHFHECLDCINLAIQNAYPKEKIGKLLERRASCMQKLKSKELIYKEKCLHVNNTFLYDLCSVEWFNEEENEYGVQADRDLDKGQIILCEKPFVNCLHPDNYNNYCYYCFDKLTLEKQYPCRSCVQVNFCSVECEENCWNSFHCLECGFIVLFRLNENLDYHTRICAKILINYFLINNSSINQFLNSLLKLKDNKSKRKLNNNYESFYDLIEHPIKDKNNYSLISLFLTAFLTFIFKENTKDDFENFTDEHLILIKTIIEKHIRQIQVNSIMLTEIDINDLDLETNENEKCLIPEFEILNLGIGVFMNLSLLNHSCDPNLSVINNNGQKVIIRTNRKIYKNEWLNISYGANHRFQTLEKRKKMLFETYLFYCECSACRNYIEPTSKSFICSLCKTCIFNTVQCPKCKSKFDLNKINQLIKPFIQKSNLIKKLLDDNLISKEQLNKFIKSLIECKEMMDKYMHPENENLYQIHYYLIILYSRLNKYEDMYKYILICWKLLIKKLDYFDLMSFNEIISFSNLLVLLIEDIQITKVKKNLDKNINFQHILDLIDELFEMLKLLVINLDLDINKGNKLLEKFINTAKMIKKRLKINLVD